MINDTSHLLSTAAGTSFIHFFLIQIPYVGCRILHLHQIGQVNTQIHEHFGNILAIFSRHLIKFNSLTVGHLCYLLHPHAPQIFHISLVPNDVYFRLVSTHLLHQIYPLSQLLK